MFLILPLMLGPAVAAQDRSAEDMLRGLYYRGDTELVAFEGKALAEKRDASLETRAWYVKEASATSFQWYRWPIASVLEGMKKEAPDDPWTLVSQAFAAPATGERVALCERALAVSQNPDILVICTDTISFTITGDAIGVSGDERAVTTFLEKYRERLEATSDGITAEAQAILRLTVSAKGGAAKSRDQVYALLDRALAMDPKNERALLIKAQSMRGQNRLREVVDMLGPVLAAGVRSAHLHAPYNNSLNQMEMPDAEKARLLETDLTRLAEKGSVGPGFLLEMLKLLGNYSPDGERRVAKLYIDRHPNTPAAESMIVRLIELERGAYNDWADAPVSLRKQTANKALAFLQGKRRSNPRAVQMANRVLEGALLSSDDPDPGQLWTAFRAARDDFGYKFGRELLKRRLRVAEIRQICRQTIDKMTIDARARSIEWKVLSVGRFVETTHRNDLAGWYDALGYAELQLGRLDEAEASLATAKTLNQNPEKDTDLQLHLGTVSQAKKEFEKAENHFNAALAAPWTRKTEHPAIAALKGLYIARNNTAKGLDQYIAAAYEKDRSRRRQQVLATRIKDPGSHPVFSLETQDGKPFVSADLKGKIVVVNFWGTWCPPCVKEMPLIQRLYERYKDDPRVAVITINSGDGIGLLKSFLGKNRYSFPALLEGEYVKKVGIDTFPTSWFLDREGRIVFTKVGVLDDLEVEWRLQNLLGENDSGGTGKKD